MENQRIDNMQEAAQQGVEDAQGMTMSFDHIVADPVPDVDPGFNPFDPSDVDPGFIPDLPDVDPGFVPDLPDVDPGFIPDLPDVDPGYNPYGPDEDPAPDGEDSTLPDRSPDIWIPDHDPNMPGFDPDDLPDGEDPTFPDIFWDPDSQVPDGDYEPIPDCWPSDEESPTWPELNPEDWEINGISDLGFGTDEYMIADL